MDWNGMKPSQRGNKGLHVTWRRGDCKVAVQSDMAPAMEDKSKPSYDDKVHTLIEEGFDQALKPWRLGQHACTLARI